MCIREVANECILKEQKYLDRPVSDLHLERSQV